MAFIKTSTKGSTKTEPTYKVHESFGVIGERSGDWQLELRLIS